MLKTAIPEILGTNELLKRALRMFRTNSVEVAFEKAAAAGKWAIAEFLLRFV